jgi:hypothetical protein
VGLVVRRATGGEQQPWISSSPISGVFYFPAKPSASLPPTSSVTPAGPPISQSITVPEKRGAGPFTEASITAFYSSLRAPLRIVSIARVGDDMVGVRYRFTRANGSVCSGNATVNTVFMGGKTLIKGVSANC